MKSIKNIFQFAVLSLGAIFFSHAISTSAATATVLVGSGGLKFVPAVTNITAGDTVLWNWVATLGHTSTSGNSGSANGLWNSGAKNSGQTFSFTFTNAGTFPYFCIPHASSGMTGSVIVAAAVVQPPTVTVQVGDSDGDDAFFPAVTNVPVNGRVIWNWAGDFHSTTSGDGNSGTPDGLWDSSVNDVPNSFTNTFSTAGTYSYFCSIHYPDGMVGSIIVNGPNVPPTVTFTNPASGTTLSAPASLALKANAADSDGSVTNVQFLQGATSLGNVAITPFSIAVNNLAAATYTFSAIASDNDGATATNSITVNVINPTPVNISALTIPSPGHFQFSYASDIGLSYVVQVSTNLLTGWTSIATNSPASANPTIFTDPNANNAGSFYRVGRLPNP